jgi:hypothetical protein
MFSVERATQTLRDHRGPFRFCVGRPHVKKHGFFTSEWLTGGTERDDVIEEARALLTDPRDTIATISVWSENESAFVYTFRRRDFETECAA